MRLPANISRFSRLANFLAPFRHPVIDGDLVLAHGNEGGGLGETPTVVAMDRATGKHRWSFRATAAEVTLASPIAVDDKRVYVGFSGGEAFAIDREDGSMAWNWTHGTDMAVPFVANERIIFSDARGGIIGLNPATGARISSGGGPDSEGALLVPVHDGERVIWCGESGIAVVRNLKSDATEFLVTLGGPPTIRPVVTGYGGIFELSNGAIQAWGAPGRPLWTLPATDSAARELVGHADCLWVVRRNSTITLHDAATGIDRWTRRLPRVAALLFHAGRLYADSEDMITVLDGRSGSTVAELPVPGACWGPLAAAGGHLFVTRATEPHLELAAIALEPGAVSWRSYIGGYGLS